MSIWPLIVAITFLPFWAFSQRCGTVEYETLREAEIPGLKQKKSEMNRLLSEIIKSSSTHRTTGTQEIFRIPVVVHVIHNNNSGIIGGEGNINISDDQIYSQIQVLNEDFRKMWNSNGYNNDPVGADTEIEFCLATRDPEGNPSNGILRKYYTKGQWSFNDEVFLKSLSYWPADQYLNIWVSNLKDNLLGYAQLPYDTTLNMDGLQPFPSDIKTDGIVIDYEYFGTTGTAKAPYNLGRTATHEIGHFFGLIHIWGDQKCGNDFVEDTPLDEKPNESRTSCEDYSNCNGLVFSKDMTNNYMDYSPDYCMNLFTEGQKARMRKIMEIVPRRQSLTNSPGCCGGDNLSITPFRQEFETGSLDNWTLYNPGLNNFSMTLPGGFSQSNTSFRFTSSGIFNGDTATNKNYGYLISPLTYFKNIINPKVSFDFAYAGQGGTQNTDSLVVSYQINCGDWIVIKNFTGEDLTTTTGTHYDFIPGSSHWKTVVLSIPELSAKTVGRIRLEYFSKGVNNLFIDNVSIHSTAPLLSTYAYPNPANDKVTFQVLFEGERQITATLYSAMGAAVYQKRFNEKSSFSVPIDVSGLGSGIYIFRVSDGTESSFSRILVRH